MPYTIGASHGPFTGLGNFAISKPAGIRTVVTGIPFYTGRDTSSPTRYFRLGRFTLGNTHGFQNSVPIEYAQQVAYPLPPDWEILAYDIRDGASCTFYELVAVPDLTAKQPWDRTPLPVQLGGTFGSTPGGGVISSFAYTVPVLRRLMVTKMELRVRRWTVATTLGYVQSFINVNGAPVSNCFFLSNAVGAESGDDGHGGGLILNPSNTISGTVQDTGTGGSCYITLLVSGFLFDA